jgi:sec-independent protein translocase protein TatB
MFGLSFAELAIIFVLAIVVIGPKELPAVVRAVARTLRQLRELGGEFRRNFDDLAEEAKLKDIEKDITTSMPTIIDLEGKEQPTYDISEDLAKRKPSAPKSKGEGDA